MNWTVSKQAEEMLAALPVSVGERVWAMYRADAERFEVLDYFHNGIKAADNVRSELGQWFGSNSRYLGILQDNPGTFRMLELAYSYGVELELETDQWLHTASSGGALRARLGSVTEFLVQMMARDSSADNGDGGMLVLNLGSGPGRDTVAALASPKVWGGAEVICYDTDEDALRLGRSIAEQAGVADRMRFENQDILRLRRILPRRAELAVAIGVLCGFPHRDCVRYLRVFRRYLKPGAMLVASNVSVNMLRGDVFTAWLLLNMAGWKLVYKTEDELRSIFEQAGFAWQGAFYDRHGYHCMGIGRVRSEAKKH